MRGVAVIAAVLTVACGRTDDSTTDGATDAGAVDAALCSPTSAEDCGDAAERHYYRVDLSRRCVDHASGGALEMCGCVRQAVDCWIESATGAVFTSPCSANLLPGYCRCPEDLERDVESFRSCD